MTPKQTALANLPLRHLPRVPLLQPLVLAIQFLYVPWSMRRSQA